MISEQQLGWLLAEPTNVGKLTGGWSIWGVGMSGLPLLPRSDAASWDLVQTVESLLLTF